MLGYGLGYKLRDRGYGLGPIFSATQKIYNLSTAGKLTTWLSPVDSTAIYLDDQAAGGNVSADAETIGLTLDKAQMDGKTASAFIDAQPELVSNPGGPFTTLTGFVGGGGNLSVDNGEVFLDDNDGGGASCTYTASGLTVGALYRVRIDVSSFLQTAGSPYINLFGEGNIAVSASGIVERFFRATVANETVVFGTGGAASAGDYIRVASISIKEIPGLHFLQSDTAKEPQFKKRLKANADLSGQTELVTNPGGPFTTTDDWSTFNSGVLSVDTGRLKVTNGTPAGGRATQQIAVTAGGVNAIVVDIEAGTAGSYTVRVGTTENGNDLAYEVYTSDGEKTILFTPSGSTVWISAGNNTSTVGHYTYFASISGKQVPASELYNAIYSPGVDELLTRSPFLYDQGAMVAVFGINGASQSNKWVYSEGNTGTNNPYYGINCNSTGYPKLTIRNDAATVVLDVTGTIAMLDGSPHVLTIIDYGNAYAFRVDGQDAGSGSYTRSGTLTLNTAALMCLKRSSEASHVNANLVEFMCGNPSALSLNEIYHMEQYVARTMGVTLG